MNILSKIKKQNKVNSVHSIYARIVIISLLAHVSFSVIFGLICVFPLMYYNILSVLFYIFMLYLLNRKMYRCVVAIVHIEVCLFVTVTTLYMGWGYGYAFYLIALCALVYFCPFRNIYVPYFFSLIEIILFITLKLYTAGNKPVFSVTISPAVIDTIYCYNAIASFIVILYSAFISKLSSIFVERDLKAQNSSLQNIVDHDTLTQLHSRTYIMSRFQELACGSGHFHVSIADIDNFKRINDSYGHPCGDYVLFSLSTIMKTLCPAGSHIGRWGGEEFILLFYGQTQEQVLEILEKLRSTIAGYEFQYENYSLKLTITFGLSSNEESQDYEELIRLADERLYEGKRSGKNMVVYKKAVPHISQ